MVDISMVENILWEDYYKIAWVNIMTGEYHFVKILDTDEEKPCLAARNIYEYSKLVVSTGLVPEEDIEQYQRCTNREYILSEVLRKRKRITVDFRRFIGDSRKWVRLEVVLPHDFSEASPWAVYTWKESDSQTANINDALRMLSQCFHKILKVDLEHDTHQVIKAYPDDISPANGFSAVFSQWVRNNIDKGCVFSEDIAGLKSFLEPARLRQRFQDSRDCLRLRYRRNYDGEFRWVYMELIPSIEYSTDNPVIMLYVRDIHDDYVAELHRQKALEYYCNYDTLTGLHSRFCYNTFCCGFEGHGGALAVLFADVNGLKYTNDTFGHEQGDRLITGFAEALSQKFGTECCYRISGDEFVMLSDHISRDDFIRQAMEFHKEIQEMSVPMASVGFVWRDGVKSVDELVRIAESRMYDDKHEFYKVHPEMKR